MRILASGRDARVSSKKAGLGPAFHKETLLGGSPAHEQPVDGQQYDRTYSGHDDGPDQSALAHTDQAHEEAAHKSAGNSYKNRHYNAPRIVARHDQLRQRPGYESNYDPGYDCADHSLVLSGRCLRPDVYPQGELLETFSPSFSEGKGAGL